MEEFIKFRLVLFNELFVFIGNFDFYKYFLIYLCRCYCVNYAL